MWLLEGGGVIVRRRKRVKQVPRGPAPLSDFSHGASTSEEGVDKGRVAGFARLPLTRIIKGSEKLIRNIFQSFMRCALVSNL